MRIQIRWAATPWLRGAASANQVSANHPENSAAPVQDWGAPGAPWPLRYLPDGRGCHPARCLRRHPEHDQHPARATTRCNVRMTATKAKSTISNTGGGKTVSGAWPNHDSGRQDDRLDAASYQYAAARASQSRQKAWRATLGAITMPKGDPNGECQFRCVEVAHLPADKGSPTTDCSSKLETLVRKPAPEFPTTRWLVVLDQYCATQHRLVSPSGTGRS